MESAPAVSTVVLKVAVPLAFKVADPSVLVPLRKVTLPVGTVVPDCGATVAVKVTLCPVLICVGEAVRAVVVGIGAGGDIDGDCCGGRSGVVGCLHRNSR